MFCFVLFLVKMPVSTGRRWHTPLITALERQKQVDESEFKASLVYRMSSKIARDTEKPS